MSNEPVKLHQLGERFLLRMLQLIPEQKAMDWKQDRAAVWTPVFASRASSEGGVLKAHDGTDLIELDDLICIDHQKKKIEINTQQFIAGYPANNVLLWGARGTGKSSLIHALLNRYHSQGLRLIEVRKEGLGALPWIVEQVRRQPFRFLLVCDDLSFELEDPSYKALKSVLEGSIFTASDNVLIYATSNRRHLLPESMSDNLAVKIEQGELHEGDAIEEKISLSDRFGLWLSFYPFPQDDYLALVQHWIRKLSEQHRVSVAWDDETRRQSLAWSRARGVRSGRTAQYFARHWVGRHLLAKDDPTKA